MKEVTKESLKIAANKLLINLNDEDYETLLKEFEKLTKQVDLLTNIEGVDNELPMVFPFDVSNSILREDEPIKGIDVDLALRNATKVENEQFVLPKVVK